MQFATGWSQKTTAKKTVKKPISKTVVTPVATSPSPASKDAMQKVELTNKPQQYNIEAPTPGLLCNACHEKDGKLMEMESNSPINYDSLCSSYTKSIDVKHLNGVWKYEKTFIVSNNRFFVEKVRNFYTNVPEEINILPADSVPDLSQDQIIDSRIAQRKKESEQLGRKEATLEDYMIPFDTKANYQFLNNAGESSDYFVISRYTKKNIFQNLTLNEIKFRSVFVEAFKKTYLELYYESSGVTKKFRILTLNNFNMILADDMHQEIHYFKR